MRFEELLVAQSGRFTRGQARVHGISSYGIGRRSTRGLATALAQLRRARLAHPARDGSRGVGPLVSIVRALGSGARSDSERRLVAGLRRHGMAGWRCH